MKMSSDAKLIAECSRQKMTIASLQDQLLIAYELYPKLYEEIGRVQAIRTIEINSEWFKYYGKAGNENV